VQNHGRKDVFLSNINIDMQLIFQLHALQPFNDCVFLKMYPLNFLLVQPEVSITVLQNVGAPVYIC
jgi:hypothetical protein